jgi:hypothetical protein
MPGFPADAEYSKLEGDRALFAAARPRTGPAS